MRKVGSAIMYGLGAVACGALAVVSALAAIGGEALIGIAGVVLFGGSCAACVVTARRRWSPPAGPTKLPRGSFGCGALSGAERHSSHPQGLVFHSKRRTALFTTVGSAVFLALGAWFVLGALLDEVPLPMRGGPTPVNTAFALMIGAVTMATFGVFGVLGLRSLLGRGGGIALMPDGVHLRAPAGQGWVRWEDLAGAWDAGPTGPGGTGAHVKVLARHAEGFVLTGMNRWLQRFNRSHAHMDVGFPSNYLRAPSEVVVGEIRRFLDAPSERHRLADSDVAEQVGA